MDAMFCDIDIYDDTKLKEMVDGVLIALELTNKPISRYIMR